MDKPELVDAYKYVFDEIQTIKLVMDRTMSGEGHSSVELRKTDLLRARREKPEQTKRN